VADAKVALRVVPLTGAASVEVRRLKGKVLAGLTLLSASVRGLLANMPEYGLTPASRTPISDQP
jgi:hypothetical protein